MTTQSPLSQIKKLANNLKYSAEGLATEVSAVGRGLIPVLRSDIVAKGGGVRGKLTLLEGIARYGFSTARQMRYAAFHAPDQLAFIDDMGDRKRTRLNSSHASLSYAVLCSYLAHHAWP